MAHIRQKFKEGQLDGYQKKKYLAKVVFTYILGYKVDVGHMEAVNLITGSKYSEKQIVSVSLPRMVRLIGIGVSRFDVVNAREFRVDTPCDQLDTKGSGRSE
jgi:hypothetical protein